MREPVIERWQEAGLPKTNAVFVVTSCRFRAVTHLDVSRDDVDEALARIGALLDAQPSLRPT